MLGTHLIAAAAVLATGMPAAASTPDAATAAPALTAREASSPAPGAAAGPVTAQEVSPAPGAGPDAARKASPAPDGAAGRGAARDGSAGPDVAPEATPGAARETARGAAHETTRGAAARAAATPGAGPRAGTAPPGPITEITFAVSPDQVRKGSRITLSGRAGYGTGGNAGPVDLYFRRTERDPYEWVRRLAAESSGRFGTTLVATASGDYQAVYRGNRQRGPASASDYVAVFTTRTVRRLIYSWSASSLQCHPVCRTSSPALTLSTGPVRVSFQRDCGPTRAGGSLGFTDDPWNQHQPGDPGWRDFPDGAGPVTFDLAPPRPAGHFYLTWSSVQREPGQATLCDLSYTATQTVTEREYV